MSKEPTLKLKKQQSHNYLKVHLLQATSYMYKKQNKGTEKIHDIWKKNQENT